MSMLRHRVKGDRPAGQLADRVFPRPLRAHPSCAQEVCLPGLRKQRQQPVHQDRNQAGHNDRQGAGRAGAAGVRRHKQVQRLSALLSVRRHFPAAGVLRSRGLHSQSAAVMRLLVETDCSISELSKEMSHTPEWIWEIRASLAPPGFEATSLPKIQRALDSSPVFWSQR